MEAYRNINKLPFDIELGQNQITETLCFSSLWVSSCSLVLHYRKSSFMCHRACEHLVIMILELRPFLSRK